MLLHSSLPHRFLTRVLPLVLSLVLLLLLSPSPFLPSTFASAATPLPLPISSVLNFTAHQVGRILASTPPPPHPPLYPSTGSPSSPVWSNSSASGGWTDGFFPGLLWHLQAAFPSPSTLAAAERYTAALLPWSRDTSTHDVGFVLLCSYGLGHAVSGNASYLQPLIDGAHALATRFSPAVNCTRSWDSSAKDSFLVIIDNVSHTTNMQHHTLHTPHTHCVSPSPHSPAAAACPAPPRALTPPSLLPCSFVAVRVCGVSR